MNKSIVFVVAVASLVVFIVTGSPSLAQTAKPIELKFAYYLPTIHKVHTDIVVPFARDLEKRTNGRIKVTVYPGEALAKAKDNYDTAVLGMTDIALFVHGFMPGRFPLTDVIQLPLQITSARIGSLVLWDLYDKYLKKVLETFAGKQLLQRSC